MSKKQISLQITGSSIDSPYNVYQTSILKNNLLEENILILSGSQVLKTYRVDSSVTQVIVVNGNNDCCCSSKIISI
jgi:hypothetical protein